MNKAANEILSETFLDVIANMAFMFGEQAGPAELPDAGLQLGAVGGGDGHARRGNPAHLLGQVVSGPIGPYHCRGKQKQQDPAGGHEVLP